MAQASATLLLLPPREDTASLPLDEEAMQATAVLPNTQTYWPQPCISALAGCSWTLCFHREQTWVLPWQLRARNFRRICPRPLTCAVRAQPPTR